MAWARRTPNDQQRIFLPSESMNPAMGIKGRWRGILVSGKTGELHLRESLVLKKKPAQYSLHSVTAFLFITSGSIRSIGGQRASFASTYSRVLALKERDHRLIKEGLQYNGPLGFEFPLK